MLRKIASAAAACLLLTATACGSEGEDGGDTPAAAGPVKVGFLTSFSGANAQFASGLAAAEARLKAYQDAKGECASTQIELVKGDDASSAQGALAGAQKLVQQDKVFSIINQSAFFFGAAQYVTTQAKDVPVMAGAYDGAPQNESHPDNNLFPYFPVPDYANPYGQFATYLKDQGATKIAGLSFNNPAGKAGMENVMKSFDAAGLKRGYVNTSVAQGSKDIGPLVLGILESGSDTVYLSITPDVGLAVVGGLRQANWKGEAILSASGYGDLLQSPQAVQVAQGVTFFTSWAPIELGSEATKAQSEALKKYAGVTNGIPGFAQSMGWLGMDLFLHGLEKAGCDADQAEYMKALKADASWDAGGLYPQKTDFSKVRSDEFCAYFPVLKGETYDLPNKEPICAPKL